MCPTRESHKPPRKQALPLVSATRKNLDEMTLQL